MNVSCFSEVVDGMGKCLGIPGLVFGHAPLTSMFLIAEITGGYEMIAPLAITVTLAYITIIYFEPHSLYTKRLAQKGDLITHHKDKAVLTLLRLDKVVENDFLPVHPNDTLGEMVKVVSKSKRNIFPVLDNDRLLLGVVLLDDIRHIMFDSEVYNTMYVASYADGEILEVNTAFENLTGFNRELSLGHTTKDLGIWINSERKKMFEKLSFSNSILDYETHFYTKSRAKRSCMVNVALVGNSTGKLIYVSFVDTTVRKKAVKELKESEEMFRFMAEGINDVISLHKPNMPNTGAVIILRLPLTLYQVHSPIPIPQLLLHLALSKDHCMTRDTQIFDLIAKERERQMNGVELIASENFVSEQVLEAMGSVLTNKYAEGYPGARYYGGCQIVDQTEQLAIDRLKKLFNAEYANVQPHSGAQANMAHICKKCTFKTIRLNCPVLCLK